jgi:glutaredoxin
VSEVTLYVKDGCPYCAAALKHYGDRGYTVNEFNIKQPGIKEKVLELSRGERIVPVIVENGEVSLGFNGG